MTTLYVPYHGNQPAHLNIKGHRLLILASSEEDLKLDLDLFADEEGEAEVREFEFREDDSEALASLAASVSAGVVLPPAGMSISTVIENLESELPWVQ